MKKKFNVVDLLILLVILAAVVLAGWKLLGRSRNRSTETEDQEIVYTASYREVRRFTAQQFHEGDRIFDDTTDTYMGTIEKVEVKPYTTVETDLQGQGIRVEKTGYYTVEVTVRCPGLERENGYFLSGLVELKSGSILLTYTKYVRSELQFDRIVSVGGESIG